VDGILNINKPAGRTSFSIVAQIRRLSRERRVGHAGTLDPVASGVLPVCLGKSTRLIEFLMETGKVYRARIEFGVTTDTYDAAGNIVREKDPSGIGREQLEKTLAMFRGEIKQVPPMYSALKHEGQPLYRLARQGITVERKSRPARIYRLDVIDWQPPLLDLEIECGRGTYIRSLAHDMGQQLGCGAHLKNLVRTRYGVFDIAHAMPISELEEAFREGSWQQSLFPADRALEHWPAVVLAKGDEDIVSNGGSVRLADDAVSGSAGGERCRAYTQDGRFLAVLRLDAAGGEWRPEKVFQ